MSDDCEPESCGDVHGLSVLCIDPISGYLHESTLISSIVFGFLTPNDSPNPRIGLSALSDWEEESSPAESAPANGVFTRSSRISVSLIKSESSNPWVDCLEQRVELPNKHDVCDGEELSIAVYMEHEPSDFMVTLLR
jgi:hypothetical protein